MLNSKGLGSKMEHRSGRFGDWRRKTEELEKGLKGKKRLKEQNFFAKSKSQTLTISYITGNGGQARKKQRFKAQETKEKEKETKAIAIAIVQHRDLSRI